MRTESTTPLEAVQVADGQVWLRRDIEQVTKQTEPAGDEEPKSYTAYVADEITFVDPSVSADYATAHFDELWAAHEDDGKNAAEVIADLKQQIADQQAALLELGDLVGGE